LWSVHTAATARSHAGMRAVFEEIVVIEISEAVDFGLLVLKMNES
jgi:hypothetical protein